MNPPNILTTLLFILIFVFAMVFVLGFSFAVWLLKRKTQETDAND